MSKFYVIQLEDYDGPSDIYEKAFVSEACAESYLKLNPWVLVGKRYYYINPVTLEGCLEEEL